MSASPRLFSGIGTRPRPSGCWGKVPNNLLAPLKLQNQIDATAVVTMNTTYKTRIASTTWANRFGGPVTGTLTAADGDDRVWNDAHLLRPPPVPA